MVVAVGETGPQKQTDPATEADMNYCRILMVAIGDDDVDGGGDRSYSVVDGLWY